MKPLTSNVEKLRFWLRTDLQCVAGKREFSAGRYFIAEISDLRSMVTAYDEFVRFLQRRQTVAGLFVVSEGIALPEGCSAAQQFKQCAELMPAVSDLSPEQLADGGRLGKCIELKCPVTGAMKVFDDFDAVAFCPQSLDEDDPLYDPMMGAPVPCINFSSDIYAFSMFARDLALRLKEAEISLLSRTDRQYIFDRASRQWQSFARATILGYMSVTDLNRCPVSLDHGDSIWYANHQDPAFAELSKSQYAHHMPVLYTPRIVAEWEAFFETGQVSSSTTEDITPFGFKLPTTNERGSDREASRVQ